jgi:hypothetical protein
MANQVALELGASCPDEGSFYICYDKPVRFVGCCTVDPCKTDDGVCPDASLRNTTFDKYSYNQLQPQECVSEKPEVQWFTCAENDVPFMGCCAGSPCAENGCAEGDLYAARLNDDEELAAAFMPDGHEDNGPDGGNHVHGLSTPAIVGIAVGCSVGTLIIVSLLFWWCLKRRRAQSNDYGYNAAQTHDTSSPRPDVKHTPLSPYQASWSGSPNPQSPPYNSPQHSQPYHTSWSQWSQTQVDGNNGSGGGNYQVSPYTSFEGTPSIGQTLHFHSNSLGGAAAELPSSPGLSASKTDWNGSEGKPAASPRHSGDALAAGQWGQGGPTRPAELDSSDVRES